MITIDKNVPMPRPQRRASKYPWRAMNIGDSFFAAGVGIGRMAGQATWAARVTGYKFACRTATENDVLGARVWRVA